MNEGWQEVILGTTSSDQSIGLWDVSTGTLLTNYKGNTCGRNSVSQLGHDYFVSAQCGKSAALHFWSWNKDQIHQRSFTSQQITSIACSPSGIYCAGGSVKGTIFIWETSSGRLLKYWTAHYKAVNDLKFTRDSAMLISGGEDATISVWMLLEVLALNGLTKISSCQSLVSWSNHTLPVTSIFVGSGSGDTIIISVSLDRTCKIWSLETKKLLKTFNLPTSLHSVILDRWESSVFLGGGDGRIFQAQLHGKSANRKSSEESHSTLKTLVKKLGEKGIDVLLGHTKCVNCLATTSDSFNLISGSEDASIKIWDIQSRQVLRTISGKGPISNVLILTDPLENKGNRGGKGKKGGRRLEALGNFAKEVEIASQGWSSQDKKTGWEPPPIILDGCEHYRGIVKETGLLDVRQENISPQLGSSRNEGIEEENAKLKEQVESAMKTINDLRSTNKKLHDFVMQST